jgi:mannitol/fructose-specific phosphotransferase system IIA component (Ntr-type)
MTISPSNTATEHSAILSAVSKVMSSGSVRQQLISTQTPAEFVSVIVDAENRMDQKP